LSKVIAKEINILLHSKSRKTKKPRKYDNDSIKKALKKNLIKYILTLIYELSDIELKRKEKESNMLIYETVKANEIQIMNTTLRELLLIHYKQDEEDILRKIKGLNSQEKQGNSQKVRTIMDKKLFEHLIDYTQTDQFFIDAKITIKGDSKKETCYFRLSRKYLNYLITLKADFNKIEDDTIKVPEIFSSKKLPTKAYYYSSSLNDNRNSRSVIDIQASDSPSNIGKNVQESNSTINLECEKEPHPYYHDCERSYNSNTDIFDNNLFSLKNNSSSNMFEEVEQNKIYKMLENDWI
jgi:hypothetical protein